MKLLSNILDFFLKFKIRGTLEPSEITLMDNHNIRT